MKFNLTSIMAVGTAKFDTHASRIESKLCDGFNASGKETIRSIEDSCGEKFGIQSKIRAVEMMENFAQLCVHFDVGCQLW